jgi:hypothetical protein
MDDDTNRQTRIARQWAQQLKASCPEIAREFDGLSCSDSPHALAAALRRYAEGHVERTIHGEDALVAPWSHAAIEATDWHGIAAEMSGHQSVLGDFTARIAAERRNGRRRS